MCSFVIEPTADGGFVVAGDNTPSSSPARDNFSVNKLLPASLNTSDLHFYSTRGEETRLTADDNWPSTAVPNNSIIAGRIVVPTGITLTISNMTLQFAASEQLADYWKFTGIIKPFQSGILVEPGGQLIINNATLKGVDVCHPFGIADNRQMWDGIIVMGDPTLPQTAPNQGYLSVTNSVIQDAIIGTLVDYADRESMHSSQTTFSTAIPDFISTNYSSRYLENRSYGGGIVDGTSSTWQDCRFGIRYWPHNGTKSIPPGNLQGNSFKLTSLGMADPVFYAREADGGRGGFISMISAYGVDGMNVKDNNFECDPSMPLDYRGWGIEAVNGSMNVSKNSSGNTFTRMGTAIEYTFDPGVSGVPLYIADNLFDDNIYGIKVSSSLNGLTINKNDFRVPLILPQVYPNRGTGVLLVGSTGYSVSENKFNYCPTCTIQPAMGDMGIVVNNAGDDDNAVNSNTFDALLHPSVALQQNGNELPNTTGQPYTGLQFHCNDYKKNNALAIVRAAYSSTGSAMPPTMRGEQGDCGTGDYKDMANNRFYNACSYGIGDHLYATGSTTQQVNYAVDPALPDFDPGPSGSGCTDYRYTPNTCATPPGSFDFSEACNPVPPQLRPAQIRQTLNGEFAAQNSSGLQVAAKNTSQGLTAQQSWLVAGLARAYALEGHYDSAAIMLESYEKWGEAVPFYVHANMWSDARRVLAQLPTSTIAQQNFAWLAGRSIDLYEAKTGWKGLTEEDKSKVIAIANDSIPSVAGYMAQSILSSLRIKTFQWPVPVLDDYDALKQSHALAIQSGKMGSNTENFSIHPNPTNGTLNIVSAKEGMLQLYNIQGMKVAQYSIRTGQQQYYFPANLAPGVYLGKYTDHSEKKGQIVRIVYQP